jgi:hypothetical protein
MLTDVKATKFSFLHLFWDYGSGRFIDCKMQISRLDFDSTVDLFHNKLTLETRT